MGVGFLRWEPATLLWGAGFLSLALFGFGATAAQVLVTRSRRPSPFARLDFGTASAGRAMEVDFRAGVPPRLLPCLRLCVIVRMRSQDGRRFDLELPIPPRGVDERVEISAPARGLYEGAIQACCEDCFGFFRLPYGGPGQVRLTVHPVPTRPRLPSPASARGSGPPSDGPRARNQEFLEVRPYLPGDDTRRLHWRLYAHTGALFVRVGEEEPPGRNRVVVALDTSYDALRRRTALDLVDSMAGYAAGLVEDLGREGRVVELWVPTSGNPTGVGEAAALDALAAMTVGRSTACPEDAGIVFRLPSAVGSLRGRPLVAVVGVREAAGRPAATARLRRATEGELERVSKEGFSAVAL